MTEKAIGTIAEKNTVIHKEKIPLWAETLKLLCF